MGDYQRLETDAERAEMVVPVEAKIPARSTYQRVLFLFSLLFTASVIVFFLWGLPCDLQTCTAPRHSVNWDKTLYGIELKGRMHLVGKHLVSILRSALWGKKPGGLPSGGMGGVIALSAATGQTVWYTSLHTTPLHIDCTILGGRRCLILGDSGFLMAIDYLSGLQVWKMRRGGGGGGESLPPQPEEIDFPLLVPGGGGGGVLVSLSRHRPGPHRLLFVSPSTGLITDQPPLNTECFHVYNLTYTRQDGLLHYACATRLGGSRMMSHALPKSSSSSRGGGGAASATSEPIDYSPKSNEDLPLEGEQKIIVTNKGSCPRSCQVSISVSNSWNATLWAYSAERSYAMAPLPLRFRPRLTGFLIKLWQWQNQPLKQSDGITVELIKERIVLITFNDSDLHVVNASQTDITQLCNITKNECQPQLSFQTQSALLVDINKDGRQDLISYLVSYQQPEQQGGGSETGEGLGGPWELQSRVRVVQLEAELAKLQARH